MKELHRVGIKDIKMNKDELTLDNSQEDNNDEEEKGDVEKDAVELVGVSGRVLDLVPYASTCPHPDVHVEEVTLWIERGGGVSDEVRASVHLQNTEPTVIMSSHFMSGSSSSSLLL